MRRKIVVRLSKVWVNVYSSKNMEDNKRRRCFILALKQDEVLFQVDIFHGVGSLDELLVEPVKSAPEKKAFWCQVLSRSRIPRSINYT